MRKRWIIGIVALAAVGSAYTGYWFWLARVFEQQFVLWVDQQRALGYRIGFEGSKVSGYPFTVGITLNSVIVESPPVEPQWRFRSPYMSLNIAPWNPSTLSINRHILYNTYDLDIASGISQRSFRLASIHRYTDIKLKHDGSGIIVALRGSPIVVAGEGDGRIALLSGLRGTVDVSANHVANSIAAVFDLELGQLLFDGLKGNPFGESLFDIKLVGQINGTVPPGPIPNSLQIWSNGGGHIEFKSLSAAWGPLALTADATIALDKNLQPLVAGTAVVRGYDETVDALVASGMMSQAQGATAKIALAAMAETDEGGTKVRLPVTIQDGFLFLGPLKVAAVPPIDWKM